MYIIGDPMLALIMRFVYADERLDISNEAFLKCQLAEIRSYVDQYPQEQKTARAMEWIEKYAERYRADWQKKVATQHFSQERCPDCPLVINDSATHCEIHNHWLLLLQRYAEDSITSKKYVEDTLLLLEEHKERLKTKVRSKK